ELRAGRLRTHVDRKDVPALRDHGVEPGPIVERGVAAVAHLAADVDADGAVGGSPPGLHHVARRRLTRGEGESRRRVWRGRRAGRGGGGGGGGGRGGGAGRAGGGGAGGGGGGGRGRRGRRPGLRGGLGGRCDLRGLGRARLGRRVRRGGREALLAVRRSRRPG